MLERFITATRRGLGLMGLLRRIGEKTLYLENGYIDQAIPMPTTTNNRNDHKMYLTRSFGWRRPRNPNAIEMTAAKNKNAWKWVK
jgi:hypothetical protein